MRDYAQLASWMELQEIEQHFLELATEALRTPLDPGAVVAAFHEMEFRATVRDHYKLPASIVSKLDDCIVCYWNDQDLKVVESLSSVAMMCDAPKSLELLRKACDSANLKIAKYAKRQIQELAESEARMQRLQKEYRPPSGPLPPPQPKRGGKKRRRKR